MTAKKRKRTAPSSSRLAETGTQMPSVSKATLRIALRGGNASAKQSDQTDAKGTAFASLASARSRPATLTQSQPASPGDSLPAGGHREPVRERVPSNLPILYADQILDVVYGVHTSKIVLAVETGGGGLRAVGIACIPTASLLVVAANIVRDLTAPGLVQETAERLGGVVKMMRELVPPAVSHISEGSKGKVG